MRRRWTLKDDEHEFFSVVQAATLTLLGLIIGFSFSMAISRYDQRKNYEEAEANAIGTEYVRADLLPAGDAAAVRAKLRKYPDLRIEFYRTRNHASFARSMPIPLNCSLRCGRRCSSAGATDAPDRARRCGHERRAELAGLYPGGMVEPHPISAWGLMVVMAVAATCW